MVTSINLTSPEESEKKSITGKAALIFSILLLALVLIIFLTIFYLKSRYIAEDEAVTEQISQEQSLIKGATFADIFDFEGRLDLIEKVADDHDYWDAAAKRLSGYILPEVRLQKFSGKKDATGAGTIDLIGVSQNLDSLSRQLILFKEIPDLDSLEFKNAGESPGQGDQPGGVAFEASLKINKSAFQK